MAGPFRIASRPLFGKQKMAIDLFAYGTLMFPEVAEIVANVVTWGEPVTLRGYSRFTVELPERNRGWFPAIRAAEGHVNGLLFRHINDAQLARLDQFEDVASGSYVREQQTIHTSDGTRQACVYVCGDNLKTMLGGPWDPQSFRDNELNWYLANVVQPFADEMRKSAI